MSEQAHPFTTLTTLIDEYNINRSNYTINQLQDLRESLSLTLFYISDSIAQSIANYESKDYERKRFYSEKETEYRSQIDVTTGKKFTVADVERMARMEAKEIDDACAFAMKQKERARIILTATTQILNALSGRITQLSRN